MAAANGIGRGRVDEVIDLVGLTNVAAKRAGGFSLGMGQRLGIASALLGDSPGDRSGTGVHLPQFPACIRPPGTPQPVGA